MNRAIVQKVFPGSNPAESLALVWKEKPQAMAGKVVVRMTASAINPIDLKYIRSGFLARFSHKGAILGSEGVGVIHEVGEGVSSYKLGERVIPVVFFKYYVEEGEGAWQDYLHVEEEDLVRVPDSIPDSIAAQFVINPWTVYGMLSDLCIPKSKYLVQTAAASVFGRQCIQLAKYWGIKTINIVRREELKEELKDLGADEVINSETEDIIKRVREITNGEGAYACIDAVGGILTKVVAGCVRDKGKVIVYGSMGSSDVIINIFDLIREVDVSYWSLTPLYEDKNKKTRCILDLLYMTDHKIITPLAGKTFALENFKEAIKESEAYARGGKIILIN